MFKKIHVVVAVSALFLTACGQSNTSSVESAAPTVAASFPVTIENNGTSVVIPEQPDAIISLSPTATEILFAIDAGDQVIAVDDQSNYPAEAPISDLSGFTPNLESIVALSPDLVVVSFDVDGIVAALTAAEIPVLVQYAAATLDDTYLQIAELGTATGQSAKAEELTSQMKSDIDAAIAGIHDVLSKSLGSDNAINIVHATVAALKMLERPEQVAARRGLPLDQVAPAALLRANAEKVGA
jgi:iron complex transport system substrate-binding protein